MFILASIFLSFGLPVTITHLPAGGIVYGGSSFLDQNGHVVNYYDPIYGQATLFGVLASAVGVIMLVLQRTSKKETIESQHRK